MRNKHHRLQPPTRNEYTKALHPLSGRTSNRPRQTDPDDFPAVSLDRPSASQDYTQSLLHSESLNRHRRGFGRPLSDFSQTLQSLGARAAKVGQKIHRPEVLPHIPFLSYDETRGFLREYGVDGERSLREEASAWRDEHAEVPYALHASDTGVWARIHSEQWDGCGQIAAIRQRLGFVEQDEPWSSIQLVQSSSVSNRFAERVDQLNKYDLVLSVGKLVLFRY